MKNEYEQINFEVKLKAGLYQLWQQLKEKGKTNLSWQEWYRKKEFVSKAKRKK